MEGALKAGGFPDEAPLAAFLCRMLAATPGVGSAGIYWHGTLYPSDPALEETCRSYLAAWNGRPPSEAGGFAGMPGIELFPLAGDERLHGFLVLNLNDSSAFAPFRSFLSEIASAATAALELQPPFFAAVSHARTCPPLLEHGNGIGPFVPANGGGVREEAYEPPPAGIIEHKLSEDELRRSELLYRTLVMASSDIEWITDARGEVTAPSPRWLAFTGQTFSESQGSGWLAAVHPDDRERTVAVWLHAVESQALYETEYRVRHHSGEYRHVSVRGVPIRGSVGDIYGWAGYCTDITERKRAEQALAESEEQFRALAAAIPDAMLCIDDTGRIFYWNPAATRIFGYTAEEALGQNAHMLLAPARYLDAIRAGWPRFAEGGEGPAIGKLHEFSAKRKDGSEFPVEISIAKVQLRGSWNAVGVLRDITRRKQASEALQLQADQYATLLSASSDAYWLVNPDLKILDTNDAATFQSGYSREELLTFNLRDLAGDHPQSEAHLEEIIRNGYCRYETELLRKDGELRQVEVSAAYWRAAGLIMAFSRDITERKKAEDAFRLQADQYAAILTASSDGFWLLGPDCKIIDVNDTACRMTGYSREELLTFYAWDIDASMTREEMFNYLEHLRRNKYLHIEHKERRKDGSFLDAELSISYWKTNDQFIVFSRDITGRRRAEEALRQSEAKLREAQKIAEVGSWDWDLATGALNCSPEECQILGRDAGEPPPSMHEFLACVHTDDRKKLRDSINALRKNGAPVQLEYRIVGCSGEARTVEARMMSFPGEDGAPARITGTTRDITAAKQNEERLKSAWLYARNLIEASLDPVIAIGAEGRIADINKATMRVFGATREKIIGTSFAAYFLEADGASAAFQNVLSSGYVTNYPLTIRDTFGDVRYLLLNASVFRNLNGEIEGVVAVTRDITQQKRREQELAALQEQLTATVAGMRRHERDTAVIGQLSETLQTCKTHEEAYPLIAIAAKRLFPWASGALAVFVSGNRELATAVTWGNSPLMTPGFQIDDCWALRRGQLHQLDGPDEGALCRHFQRPPPGATLCLPLTSPVEPLGLLHLSADGGHAMEENDRRLAVTFGDVLGLSLSNLRLRDHLRMQAIRDPLTKLFNRHYLAETLPREFLRALRQESPLSLAILDIDHFKYFNDSFGHDAGDLVLREVSALLIRSLRAGDLACRYGGEEFLLVLPDCDLATAGARIASICGEIKRMPHFFRGQTLPEVTMSAGIAQLCACMTSEAELITAADKALLAAKSGGRDRIERADPVARAGADG